MIKWVFIGIFVAIGILDVLLILGCAELERRREEYDRKQTDVYDYKGNGKWERREKNEADRR